MSLSKILNIALAALMAISVALIVVFFVQGLDDNGRPANENLPMLLFTYGLVGLSLVAVVGFFLFNAVTNIKVLIRAAIGLGIFVVIGLVAFLLSSDAVIPKFAEMGTTPETFLYTETGLFVTYILIGVSILSIIVTNILKLFR